MSRARNIKPGFFKNEDLAECSPWARLCFIGLWILADRDGRLEDRPKRIKAELFAFDSVEVEPLLQELERHGFIFRYTTDGVHAIQILKFTKHQSPHYTEKPSVINPPQLQDDSWSFGSIKTHKLQDDSRSSTGVDPPSRGGHYPLNPDSPNPDSPNPEPNTCNPNGLLPLGDADQPPQHAPPKLPECPHQQVLALWAKVLPELPQHQPQHWRGARADHLRVRWRETAQAKEWRTVDEGLAYFEKFFRYVRGSDFLMGRTHSRDPNRRPFVAELEWLVKPANWAKVHEGKYHPES